MKKSHNLNPYHFVIALVLFMFLFMTIDSIIENQPDLTSELIIHQKSRILEQQQKKSDEQPPRDPNKSKFLMVIVIGSIVFLVVGLICCVICIVRCIIRIQRGRSGGAKVTNVRVNYTNFCPKIQYSMFLQFIGQPYQDNCVICLEQFAPPALRKVRSPLQLDFHEFPDQFIYPDSDEIKIQEQQTKKIDERRQSHQTEYIENQNEQVNITEGNTVKLTICGHVLHAKCLDSWLEKQQNCPLCREVFTAQSLQDWERKIGIDILKFDASIQSSQNNTSFHSNVGETSKKAREANIHETLNSMNKSVERNNFQTRKQLEDRKMRFLTPVTKNILVMYSKIMAYHRKQEPNLQRIQKLEQLNNDPELYFEQNNQQNSPGRKHSCDDIQIIKKQKINQLKRRPKPKSISEIAINP